MSKGDMEHFPDPAEMLKALECPICFEIFSPPIFQCTAGHSFCGPCRNKIEKCSTCNGEFGNVRNLSLESMVELLNIKCMYEKDGCEKILKSSAKNMHHEICPFRPVFCNAWNGEKCVNTAVDYSGYLDHLISTHGSKRVVEGSPGVFRTSWEFTNFRDGTAHAHSIMRFDEKEFIRFKKCGTSYVEFWYCVMGTAEEAAKYAVEVTITPTPLDPSQSHMRMKFVLPVKSIHASAEEIQTEGMAEFGKATFTLYCLEFLYNHVFDVKTQFLEIQTKEETEVA